MLNDDRQNQRPSEGGSPVTPGRTMPFSCGRQNMTNGVNGDATHQPKRAMRLNVETLPEEWRAFCVKERPDLEPERVFAEFRDYWIAQPGKDGTKLDWTATWRNRVRQVAFKPGRAAYQAPYGAPRRDTPRDTPLSTSEWQPPTPEQIRLSKQIVAKIRGVGRNLSGEGNDDWAKRLKARAIAGEQLQPCQLRAMREALADEPPTADELEAIQERAAIMAEGA